MKNVYQLKNGLFVEQAKDEYGTRLVLSDHTISNAYDTSALDTYVTQPKHKIPLQLWNQLISFFMHFKRQRLEVQARIYKRDGEEFICCVPYQEVENSYLRYDYNKGLMSLDGRSWTLKELVAQGWIAYAHIHLHPFDMADPSQIDDKNELDTPLLYGIVSIPTHRQSENTYRIRMTIVANNGVINRRYKVNSPSLIAFTSSSEIQEYTEVPYSTNCLSLVNRFKLKINNLSVLTPSKLDASLNLTFELACLLQYFSKEEIAAALKSNELDKYLETNNYNNPWNWTLENFND